MNYSEPKIFTGGVDIRNWSKLTRKQQKHALEKDWYVYYSFRNPDTGRLERQPNIKGGANYYKDKKSRLHILQKFQKALSIVLQKGYNPYQDNTLLIDELQHGTTETIVTIEKKQEVQRLEEEPSISISAAIELVFDTKIKVMNASSFTKYKSRIKLFEKWLKEQKVAPHNNISEIDKKHVIQYLNKVLYATSPRNRNNTRTDLSSFFQTLEDNDVIKENFIRKINVLKSVPQRNKSYTPEMLAKMDAYLRKNDPLLRLFIQFISYNFLRPIEVCRLQVKDIDPLDKKLYVKAKNQPVKIKIIPDILIREIPDISSNVPTDALFTPTAIGGTWDVREGNKRDYFTKRFKKVKDHFDLGTDYGLYSFRHTFITKLYRQFTSSMTPFEAKSKLKLITGHSTMKALELYLREIDAELPQDYSDFLK